MNKLEKTIYESLKQFQDSQINIRSSYARSLLARAVADFIKEKIEKERK